MFIPSLGHKLKPTASTIEYSSGSSVFSSEAHIQLAEIVISLSLSISAANKFVIVSAITTRADPGPSMHATGPRSPRATAVP